MKISKKQTGSFLFFSISQYWIFCEFQTFCENRNFWAKIVWRAKKSIFSKYEISIPRSNHGKGNIKLMLVRPWKRFRTICGVSEIIAKNWIFAVPKHVFVGIFTETYFGRAKIHCFSLISDMSQVVLKRFSARTSIVLMLLFSWLDRGVDILDV